MSTTKQVTITLPAQYLEAARRHTGSGETLSGIAAQALRRELLRRDMEALADDGYTGAGGDWQATIEHDREQRLRTLGEQE